VKKTETVTATVLVFIGRLLSDNSKVKTWLAEGRGGCNSGIGEKFTRAENHDSPNAEAWVSTKEGLTQPTETPQEHDLMQGWAQNPPKKKTPSSLKD